MLKKLLLCSAILVSTSVLSQTQVRSWCEPKANSDNYTVHVSISRVKTPGTDYVSVFLYPDDGEQLANHYKIPNGTYNYNFKFLDVTPGTWVHINNDDGNINQGPNGKSGPGTCLM